MSLSKQKLDEVGDACPVPAEQKNSKIVNTVLGIPELREMIIRQVIYPPQGNKPVLCREIVRHLRFLSKDWLLGITKTLNVDKTPLFQLEMNEFNSLIGAPELQFENGKLLDNYVDRIYSATTPSVWNKVLKPLFSLKILADCFREENYGSLLNCFEKCGNELLKLELIVPVNGGSMVCDFPDFALPGLEELKLCLTTTPANTMHPYQPGETPVTYSANVTHLLKSVLNASTGLKTFSIPNNHLLQQHSLPDGFYLLKLPQSITQLEFDCKMRSEELEMLVRNPLPNLSTFKLYVPSTQFTEGLIAQVLDNHKTTLKELYLISEKRESFWPIPITPIHTIRLPELNKLKVLRFSGLFCQLERETRSLERLLPKLEKLHLSQTERCFRTWTNSTLPQVTNLQFDILGFPNEFVLLEGIEPASVSVNRENMQLLHHAFPNVTVLKLSMSGRQTRGIQYLFREMGHLRELKLRLDELKYGSYSDKWNALLIGTTVEMLKTLRESPDRGNLMTHLENSDTPSIRMLEELEKLELVDTTRGSRLVPAFRPLISDLAFTHAFLEMPKLTTLYFEGGFKPSDRMQDIWRKDKGSISYYNGSDWDW